MRLYLSFKFPETIFKFPELIGIHISTCSHLMHYRCYQKSIIQLFKSYGWKFEKIYLRYIEISNNRERTRRIGINLNVGTHHF